MFETAVFTHATVECVLSGVTEWRVAEIVRQTDCLDKILVEPERAGNCPGNLSDLKRVRQSSAIKITLVVNENLGLVHQTAKRRRMNYTVPIPLKFAAKGRRLFGKSSSGRALLIRRVGRQICTGMTSCHR